MIDARLALLATALAFGWAALALATLVSPLPPDLAVLAALLSTASVRPGWSAAIGVVVVAVVVLLGAAAGSTAVALVAPVVGVLLLAALVLSDLSDHAAGASRGAVVGAIRRMLPGFMAAAAAALLTAVAGAVGRDSLDNEALAVAVPWLLVAAVLIALPISTRRAFWAYPRSKRPFAPETGAGKRQGHSRTPSRRASP